MRRGRGFKFIKVVGLAVLLIWSRPSSAQNAPGAVTCNVLSDLVPANPADLTTFDSTKLSTLEPARKKTLLTSGLPCTDITVDTGPNTRLENRQRGFDFYSWLSFIALNAPATSPKEIATSRPNTPAVWESADNFIPLLDVMLPGGVEPKWDVRVTPPACQKLHALHPKRMVVKMIEESFNQPFKTGPLIDQRNNYAIFDILMNKVMFNYIVKNNLYSRAGQMRFANSGLRIDFPPATLLKNKNGPDDVGSLMLKVSWKILEPEDDKNKFHYVDALVAMPNTPDEQSDPPCLEKTLGLVGFHAVHKTENRPQWIWTSFEHVDNVPEQKDVDARKLKRAYNFYDPSCVNDCPANETPPRPWDPEPENKLKFRLRQDGKVLFNSQIVRTIPLTEATNSINAQFHSLFPENSVWKNYMLIGTQWPSDFVCTRDQALAKNAPAPFTDFDKQPDMNCAPTPTFLANSTLETFSQGDIPQASSSCMACHGNATSYLRAVRVRNPKDAKDAKDTKDAKDVKEAKEAKDGNDAENRKRMFMNQSDFTFMLEKAR